MTERFALLLPADDKLSQIPARELKICLLRSALIGKINGEESVYPESTNVQIIRPSRVRKN